MRDLVARREWNRQYEQTPKRKEYRRQYRQKNKERILEQQRPHNRNWMKQYYLRMRSEVIQLFGGKCVRCGCDNPLALEINHINGGGRKEPVGRGCRFYRKILDGKRKTDDLELLCGVCNTHHKLTELKGLPDNWEIKWSGV
ncbi:unnamed protein product [marine sediment metagenome]|uniref:Uncharacterized protein n=1 Tax=marine sediment metagenome TaxID=412755 RepID=X1P8W1_9ZZZZ